MAFGAFVMYAETRSCKASKESSPALLPALVSVGDVVAAELAETCFFGQSLAQCGGSVVSPHAMQRFLSPLPPPSSPWPPLPLPFPFGFVAAPPRLGPSCEKPRVEPFLHMPFT